VRRSLARTPKTARKVEPLEDVIAEAMTEGLGDEANWWPDARVALEVAEQIRDAILRAGYTIELEN